MTHSFICHVEQAKRVETSRGSEQKNEQAFPRDSSASLGMTKNKMLGMTDFFTCHVEQAQRRLSSRGSVVEIAALLSLRGTKSEQ